MPRDDAQLSAAKRAYRTAAEVGNRQEEARWANVIGDILKNRGEYVEALKWLRIDYDISVKYLPEKQLLPTCQSLGEIYLRLQHFKDALVYQKKHLELAKDSDDLIEQQRASTQLGRTYHEMFLKSNDNHCLVRNSKRYFKAAMELAQSLKDYPTSNKSSFLKEFIDAHNNIGMLEMDLDNLEEAEKILTKGLEICDEEEVIENDDGRSRLHHNLGNVYMELRMWEEARKHIETDIIICKNIGHCQGEAKGYINLGELHYRVQRYDEATLCYKKALDLAKSMEDEDALADQIDQNIETVKEAVKVMDDLRKEEQNLKKLSRKMGMTRSLEGQRKYLIELNVSLDCLIEKSSMIFAWKKHLEFSKRKKRIAHELFDKEKMSDSYLVVGESYQKLRNFKKALKWYRKAWETYKEIGNMEGQALAKINIGDVLDCIGNWSEALEAFEAGHRIAVEADLQAVQISALENMHYSNMIRFDDVEEARRLQYLIDKLKQSKNGELDARAEVGCSDTDTECDDHSSNSRLNRSFSAVKSKPISSRSQPFNDVEELDDEMPLISLLWPDKPSAKLKKTDAENQNVSSVPTGTSPKSLSKSISNQQAVVGRKRGRVVLSDDEGEMNDGAEYMEQKIHKYSAEDVATSIERKSRSHGGRPSPFEFQDISAATSKCVVSTCIPIRLEESTCSYKSNSSNIAAKKGEYFKSPITDEIDIVSEIAGSVSKYTQNLMHKNYGGEYDQIVTFKIDNEFIHMGIDLRMPGGELGIEFLKAEVACLYYLQLPVEKRMKGLLPVIQHMTCNGSTLESLEAFTTIKDHMREGWVEAIIDGWVQKSLMKLYIDCCEELSEAPNLKLLKKLYNLEVSEDEVIVSECELQDLSIAPLLTALHAHQTVAVLDLSHNLLGNGTMEKLRKVFTSSDKNYGGLTLDLHCNLFGPTALFQICQCPLLFARLEVLNISGNRLTDACGSYLLTILENCKALYSLNMERCSITSRTIQKIADSLDPGCVLAQLWLGHNSPLSGAALMGLLDKLANLKRFSELNLNGLKLCKPVVDSLCQLLRRTSLSGLMLGGTNIGTAGALQLTESLSNGTQDLAKLDLSLCGLTSQCMVKLNTEFPVVGCVTELNLGGNCIKQEGSTALASLLKNSHCCIRVLVLSNCHLGLTGFLCILHALAENSSLEELNLAENVDTEKNFSSQNNALSSELSRPSLNISDASPTVCVSEKVGVDVAQLGECGMSTDCSRLEVADSEDELNGEEPAVSGFGDSSTSRQGNPSFLECQFIQKLSDSIGTAKLLTLLDLSKNGFSAQVVDTLYTAWSMSARAGLCQKHIKGEIIHFSVEGVKCCKVRPCCRRD